MHPFFWPPLPSGGGGVFFWHCAGPRRRTIATQVRLVSMRAGRLPFVAIGGLCLCPRLWGQVLSRGWATRRRLRFSQACECKVFRGNARRSARRYLGDRVTSCFLLGRFGSGSGYPRRFFPGVCQPTNTRALPVIFFFYRPITQPYSERPSLKQ